ncbi:sulfurtransferase complex subunit TusC [Paraneptunicella aestuarii]|uniref:sulfurtransferase complex subunit TusC n=1 Tax=Paraneptunicella aestuarii TaxID=2831148 RepID=UPI001E5088CF|nr:sulfurtransferase complex subunit TusC [Paraneptunicella aestuarii]UAA37298.1 sulfurtransferase complex subunit TusC [Paraneptunicella aestuarii]
MSIAILHTTAPSSNPNGLEALDTAFAFANIEQQVGMFFIQDGVYQLLKGQQPEISGFKNHTKSYPALEFYDIEDIFVCTESLKERNLTSENLLLEATLMSPEQLASYLKPFDQVLRF